MGVNASVGYYSMYGGKKNYLLHLIIRLLMQWFYPSISNESDIYTLRTQLEICENLSGVKIILGRISTSLRVTLFGFFLNYTCVLVKNVPFNT